MLSLLNGHEATCTATMTKQVCCSRCGGDYSYEMTRTATGVAFDVLGLQEKAAQERAQKKAEELVQLVLENECEPVPCPRCGSYQPDMVVILHQRRRGWMLGLGKGLVFGAGLVAFLAALKTWPGPWPIDVDLGIAQYLWLAALIVSAMGLSLVLAHRLLRSPKDLEAPAASKHKA